MSRITRSRLRVVVVVLAVIVAAVGWYLALRTTTEDLAGQALVTLSRVDELRGARYDTTMGHRSSAEGLGRLCMHESCASKGLIGSVIAETTPEDAAAVYEEIRVSLIEDGT